MKNVRVSVTDIDSYCYWRSSEYDFDLLARLRKEEPPNEAMRAGSAFHKALENGREGKVDYLEADGYRFILPLGMDISIALPTIRELKVEREIPVQGLTVTLVGKVDAMFGTTIYDHKTAGKFDADKIEQFSDSYQWRMYLWQLDADRFVWNVFVTSPLGPQEYSIDDFHLLAQCRYRGMAEDCAAKLNEFLDFLNVRNLRWPRQDCRLADLLIANK